MDYTFVFGEDEACNAEATCYLTRPGSKWLSLPEKPWFDIKKCRVQISLKIARTLNSDNFRRMCPAKSSDNCLLPSWPWPSEDDLDIRNESFIGKTYCQSAISKIHFLRQACWKVFIQQKRQPCASKIYTVLLGCLEVSDHQLCSSPNYLVSSKSHLITVSITRSHVTLYELPSIHLSNLHVMTCQRPDTECTHDKADKLNQKVVSACVHFVLAFYHSTVGLVKYFIRFKAVDVLVISL